MFNKITATDLAFFESIAPGRVFSGETISTDYDHDEMLIYRALQRAGQPL